MEGGARLTPHVRSVPSVEPGGYPMQHNRRKNPLGERPEMSPEDGKMKPPSAGVPDPSTQLVGKKPYNPPHLQSLGSVRAMTLGITPSVGEARRRPHG